jgi:hypothetical protein
MISCDMGTGRFQMHTASTASFLVAAGHKPLLKFSSVTSMAHSFLFRHICNNVEAH